MRSILRYIAALFASLGRSGPAVFICSLALGLTLSASSLVFLELLNERREVSYQDTGSLDAAEGPGSGARIVSHAEQPPSKEPTESEREGPSRGKKKEPADGGEESAPEHATRESAPENEGPDVRDLEEKLRSITAEYPGEYGILLWQPDSGARVAVGAEESFSAASLAKLPVLLALYRDASEGRLSLDDRITMRPEDIRSYGTGVLYEESAGTTMTLRECARYLIKESDNTAWAMLERRLGEERIRKELDSAGARSSRYATARYMTSPEDMLKVLRRISDPGYTSPEHSREMLAMMTDTAYEDRLPQGLPEDARIHHKIGSVKDSFGDAGMVVPADKGSGGPYYIVVMSRDAGGAASARRAMREISLTAYRQLADPNAEPRSTPKVSGLASGKEQARG